MEEKTDDFFAGSRKELEQYLQDRIWLLKLQAGEKAARLIAVLFSLLLIGLMAFFVVLFLSMMAGYYFSAVTGSFYTGFGILAGFYVLLLILLIIFREWVRKRIMDIVIRIFFAKKDEDEKP